MLKQIKIIIKKSFDVGRDWKRWKSVDKIMIDEFSPMRTEAQLASYIYNRFGEGRYMLLAWQKGYEGFWLYWIGFCYDNGFIREKRKNKDLEQAKVDLHKAQSSGDQDEVEFAEDMLSMEQDISKDNKHIKKYGPIGLIKQKPGVLYPYEDY